MKRILLGFLVLLLLAVLVVGTLSLIQGFSASRLEKWKRAMRAKGEKLLVSELAPEGVISNALIPRLVEIKKELGRAAPSLPMVLRLSPDVAQAAARHTNSSPSMHKLLDEKAVALAEMREALKSRPRDLGWNYTNWNTYPGGVVLITLRESAYWLAAAVMIEVDRSRRADALTNVLSLLDLAHCHEREGTLVAQMVRVALAGMAFQASWEVLQVSGWTDAELAELQRSWEQLAMSRPVEFALQMERASALTYFEMGRKGDTNAVGLIVPLASLAEGFYAPVWKMGLSKGDELYFLQTIQRCLDALRTARDKQSGLELQKRLGAQAGWLAPYRYPMSHALTPNIEKALNRWIRRETERQMVLAAIGLERYRLRHGRYPEKLEELVPEILAKVPVDFGDGKALRYKRAGETFELWSVWEDVRWPRAE